MSKVALVYGKNRAKNIKNSLHLIEDEIKENLKDKNNLLLKPNIVNINSEAGTTNKETLAAILEFLRSFYKGKIILGEGAGVGDTFEAFRRLGYLDLQKPYDLELVDLNKTESTLISVYGPDLKKNFPQHISNIVLDADYIISVALLKTHDSVVATFGLKNLIVGSFQEKCQFGMDKTFHQGYPAMNRTLAELAGKINPDLTILDGMQAMGGNGPSHGDLVRMNIAIASTDWLAADILAMNLMGFKLEEIGYLFLSAKKVLGESDPEKMNIVGEKNWKKFIKKIKPHPNYPEHIKWR